MHLPKKIYCIHITNLARNADAEILSKKFGYSIGNILINSPSDNQSLPIECWLKSNDELEVAKNFKQHWNGQLVLGSQIVCEIEEDKLELCMTFRIGRCRPKNGTCDWEHIKCTANGTCSKDCRYGHEEGVKPEYISNCKLALSFVEQTKKSCLTDFKRMLVLFTFFRFQRCVSN